jgi:hypothetical protein
VGVQGAAGLGSPEGDSPDVAAAKAEMDRLRTQYGITPPADSKGEVHLQSGGTLTKDQYQKALDSLQRSNIGR